MDVELLLTLAGYVAIAIENATLYRSLQLKVEEYERLKEFSENIVESINVGILAADLEDRVESWNSQIEQLTGIAREQAVGQTPARTLPGRRWPSSSTGCAARPASITSTSSCSSRPPCRAWPMAANGNGQWKRPRTGAGHARLSEATLNIAIAPLVSKDQEQIGRLIIFDDVTDRAELEQRLVQADKLSSIGLLAAGVAHEVNTPLAVISTYAQMLAKQVAEDSQKSLILEKIAKQTFRASEIVNSLLNFSRTSTTSYRRRDLNRVMQETLSLLEHQFTKAGIQISVDLDPELPPVHGNGGKLQQVFLNLFLNARDAMGAGGTLEVRSWAEGLGARVEVSDTGHGIAPEQSAPHLRPLLHHQGRQKGHRAGTFGHLRYHSRAWRLDRSLQPARRRRPLPGGTSAGRPRLGKEAGNRRINDRSPEFRTRPQRQNPGHRR